MPRETCHCGECQRCHRRAYMAAWRWRKIRGPLPAAWVAQARTEAWQLQRYICPLAELAKYQFGRKTTRPAAE
jgi:hypothetical protein